MARKSATPDSLRLLVNPLQKVSLAFGDMPRKNVETRQPSTFGQFLAKSLASVRRYAPKKRSHQTAFGFGSIPYEKSHQPSELCSEKTFRPSRLRLLVNPPRKTSPAFGDVPRKNVEIRQPPAFGRYSAKGTSSVRRCIPKKRSGQRASGFWSIPCKKSRQPSEIYPRKTFTPDSLRLLVNPLQKVPSAFGDVLRKYVHIRQPLALG